MFLFYFRLPQPMCGLLRVPRWISQALCMFHVSYVVWHALCVGYLIICLGCCNIHVVCRGHHVGSHVICVGCCRYDLGFNRRHGLLCPLCVILQTLCMLRRHYVGCWILRVGLPITYVGYCSLCVGYQKFCVDCCRCHVDCPQPLCGFLHPPCGLLQPPRRLLYPLCGLS